jgi:hypothetical protein
MFDFVGETLNQMTFFVDKPVTGSGRAPVAARWNDGCQTAFLNGRNQRISVIALVTDKGLGALRSQGKQGLGLTDIAGLPTGQHEFQRISQRVSDRVDLGAESTPGSSQGLIFGVTTPLRQNSCRL